MIDRVGDGTSLPGFRLENAKSQPLTEFYTERRCVLTFLAHERPSNRTTLLKWWCFSFSRHCNIAGREKRVHTCINYSDARLWRRELCSGSCEYSPGSCRCFLLCDFRRGTTFFLFTVRRKLLSYLGDNKDNGSVISLILKIICCRYSNFLVFLSIKDFDISMFKYSR